MNLETLIGKPHFHYKTYTEKFNIVVEAIDEIAFLSNTLDYKRLIVFFKEVIETFDYYKNIDENDDNSEGFSNMNNKEQLLLNIIDSDEYNNLINFLETYQKTIIRKCDNLKEKILDLKEFKSQADREAESSEEGDNVKKNPYIAKDYDGNVELMKSKMNEIADKLQDNIENEVPIIEEKKLKFNIKIITNNDIICILSLYRSLKNFVYKQMHVLYKEYYTATKEDILAFRKELYKLYELICKYFNKNKNTYLEDISEKFQEVVDSLKGGTVKAAKAAEVVEVVEAAEAVKDDAVKAAEGTEVVDAAKADIAIVAKGTEVATEVAAEDDEEEDFKKLDESMKVYVPEKTEADNKRQLQNELDKPLDSTAGTRAAPEAPEAQLKEELNKINTYRSFPIRPVVEEPINTRQLAEDKRKAHLNNSLSPTPTPQPSPKTPVDGATDAIKTQLEAQGKAAANAANAAQATVEAELKAKAVQLTAVKEQAEAKLKGATASVAGAQAKAEAGVAQAQAAIDAEIAKQKAAVDNILSPFTSITKQLGTKGANREPVSQSRMFAQLAQSVLKQPNPHSPS